MSRHLLQPVVGVLPYPSSIAIGWDPPLATFFAIVSRSNDDEDNMLLWIGTHYAELPEPDAAIDAVRPYAVIPDDLKSNLESDRRNEGARPRPPWLA
ncbi:hypothetical protein [Sphingomonas panacis]|uniref:hypothetical protein n=1 Tax=Sphingomonas panacis TaxID=1560345 RepID=UPI0009F568A9|nr:hypothetical protein [Sphingomonas panacis]